MRAEGLTIEEVYLDLLSKGFTVAEIQAAEAQASKSSEASQARVVRIVLILGAILVAAGAFSFVAANWQSMPAWGRVALIVVSSVAASSGGGYFREVRGHRWTGEVLLLLGSAIFGAGIFLVAQIYNIRGNWPDGLILWMIGALAVAFATRSLLLFVLAAGVGTVAAVAYPLGLLPEQGFLDPYLLTSPLLVLVGAAAAFVAGYLLRRSIETPAEEKA
jgi:uncharacterized membrane protein